MASNNENSPDKMKAGLLGPETVLAQNDKTVTTDSDFSQTKNRLIDRSKLLFWWRSISSVFRMIAGMLIPGAIALVTGSLAHSGTLGPAMTNAVIGIAGIGVASLAIGMGLDYYENIVGMRQGFDMQDATNKRNATHMARAFNELGAENPYLKTNHAEGVQKTDALQKLQAKLKDGSWEEKTRCDAETAASQQIH